jgi:iron complex outermembrane receptor protein
VFTVVPKRLSVTGGLKLEYNTFSGTHLQPSGRLLWTPTDRQSLWGGVTRGVRTPSRVDEDITVTFLSTVDPLVYGVLEGTDDLDPESTLGYEAGYRALLTPTLYLDVTAFRNRYEDLIDIGVPRFEPRTTDGVSYTAVVLPWANAIDGYTRGFEVAPDWQVADALRVRGSYSYLDVSLTPRRATGPRVALPIFAGAPRHHVTVQGLATLPRRIEVDPVYRYVSERAGQGIPAYHAFDLRVGIPLTRGFSLAIAGQNLFDGHHPEWLREPGPAVEIRRSAYVRLTWRR